ncbi:hypothetical protein F2Q68_00019250 [Brassica cretica]|uniref:Helicase C-terminal domain-containing protein n=1 Tax=Brassica cretica TaxID=69181 RepID=A0A8S9FR54_BRACR|nr:hypothetical protein F2Q68_00019250 [Brassica cretica]
MRTNNFTVSSMHGDMPQKERDEIMNQFRSGDSRGIDVQQVISHPGQRSLKSASNHTVMSPSCNEWHLRIFFIVTRALYPSRDFSVYPLYAICNCTNWLSEKMRTNNFTVSSMHGDMPQKERDEIMN